MGDSKCEPGPSYSALEQKSTPSDENGSNSDATSTTAPAVDSGLWGRNINENIATKDEVKFLPSVSALNLSKVACFAVVSLTIVYIFYIFNPGTWHELDTMGINNDPDPTTTNSHAPCNYHEKVREYPSEVLVTREKMKLQHKCLQSNEKVDELIHNAKQIVIVMPAKAAGKTMKDFTMECMNREFPDNFLNDEHLVQEELMMGQPLSVPKIVASHMYTDKPLRKLIEQLPRSALLIYMHREESDRVLSAIKHVYNTKDVIRKKNCDVSYNETSNTCIVQEKTLVSSIEAKIMEIHIGETEILTCDTYNAIQNNAPNMIFVHYKQADRLQRLLAKYHCPNMLEKDTIKEHVAKDLTAVTKVRLNSHLNDDEHPTEDVYLSEWVEAKAEMLQFAFGLRDSIRGCQSSTRKMEDALFACETEILHI